MQQCLKYEYLDTRSVSLAMGPWNLGSHLHPPYRVHDTLQGLVFPGLASGATSPVSKDK